MEETFQELCNKLDHAIAVSAIQKLTIERDALHAALLRVLQEGYLDPRLLCVLQAKQALALGD